MGASADQAATAHDAVEALDVVWGLLYEMDPESLASERLGPRLVARFDAATART